MENTEFEPWSREWVIQQHRAMYHWIANKIYNNGIEYHDQIQYRTEYIKSIGLNPLFTNCFCCEYVHRLNEHTCDKCPLDWNAAVSGFTKCACNRLFNQLNDAIFNSSFYPCTKNVQKCIELTNKIADVPEKVEES